MFTKNQTQTVEPAESYDGQRWEYLARNLKKVAGPVLEGDFNRRGQEGWEFVAVADGYAIFKRLVRS